MSHEFGGVLNMEHMDQGLQESRFDKTCKKMKR